MKYEIYKKIESYEDYCVSNKGNVKSLKFGKEKILSPRITSAGYNTASLCLRGKQKTFQVHILEAKAFLGHKPELTGLIVDHKDNNKLNNNLSNLQIITQRKNTIKDLPMGSSKYTGVCWSKTNNKWVSHISLNGKPKYLGYFVDEKKASEAYQKALSEFTKYYH